MEEVGAASSKNYITAEGAKRLRDELHQLLHVARPEVVRTVSWAASNGDRSENGDYIYGKRRLREIDRRIRFLTQRLEKAEVVDPARQAKDRVLFGASVTLLDEEGDSRVYRIVGEDEIAPAMGFISWKSPVGKALLGKKVGDAVSVRVPGGEQEWEILAIQYSEGNAVPGRTVLVVEDVGSMRELLMELARGIDGVTQVELAKNGAEARRALLKHRPDWVFLDEVIPGENAADLARLFAGEGIPVLLVSATPNPDAPLPPGCVGRVTKPSWDGVQAARVAWLDLFLRGR